VPVFILNAQNGYHIELQSPLAYDRAELSNRAARQKLTQEIMRVFEPFIRRYPDQWYHFVPVWDAPENPKRNLPKRDEPLSIAK
jgi:KDO2-lipid IV(A) lauroyltransferase